MYIQNSKEDFIAGHNSKATQAKVIQGQIDVLKEIDNKCFGGSNTCKAKILKLQQKLKKLENEHTTKLS